MTVFFGATSYQAFQALVKDPQKYYDQQAKDSATKTKIDYFKKNIGKYDNVDDLTKDRKLMEVLLSAYGLSDQIDLMGRIKVTLKEDYTDEDALVNKLADGKYKAMAQDLQLYRETGFQKFKDSDFINSLVDKFIMSETEKTMGEQDESLREAAYFARNIASASNVYNILGDKVLRSVVTQYLELPQEFAVQTIESQAKYLTDRLDIEKLVADVDTSSITDTEAENAKSNLSTLETAESIADGAKTQIETLGTLLETIIAAYDEQAAASDPSGDYAAEIPIQEAAIPQLLRIESMANAMDTTLSTVTTKLERLDELLALAQNPANSANIASYQSEFSTTVTAIINAINNTQSYNPATGTTENPLMFGSNTTISIQTTASGNTVDFKTFDLTDLQTYLNSATSAFNASDWTTADTAFTSANLRGLAVNEFHKENMTAIQDGVNNVEVFVATMNTQEIMRGYNSIQDNLTRITNIEDYLSQIKELADESREMVSTANRSELQAEFETLRTAIRDEIENGGVGLDNFLNNLATQTYNIIDTATLEIQGGIDLATTISDILDAGSIDTQATANAMYTTSISVTVQTDAAKASLTNDEGLFASTALLYDSRAAIDTSINNLKNNLSTYIDNAAVGDNNLLSTLQHDLTYDVTSSYTSLTLHAYNSFESDFTTLVDNIISAMSISATAAQTAATDALSYIQDIKRTISSDSRKLNFEYAKSAAVVDTLQADEEESAENPYTTTAFTQKFIERFLILNGSDNLMSSASGSDSYVLNLFGLNSDGSTSDYISKIFELIA